MTAKIHFGVTLVSNRPGRISVGLWRTLLGVLVLAGPLTMRAQDIRPTARAVDEHYNRLRSLQTDFTEIYRGDGAERTETGTLWLKKPRKMRWEYRSPKEKLFVSDGKVVWFYLPSEKQLRKTEFRKLDDLRSPIAFLLGKTKLENELTGLSKVVDQAPMNPANTLLRGVPKAMADRISEVLLEVTPSSQLARIVFTGVDGASTEFRFASPKEDLEISDRQFLFTPPPGVETVEGELGQ
jgi:outer membrane lipoprotein carrier protein